MRLLTDDDELSNYLAVIARRLNHYHESLWEEEKHYTWWIYIIIGGLILLYANHSAIQPWWRILLLFLGGCFGAFISITGLKVVGREGEGFCETQQIFDRVVIELGIHEMIVNDESLAHEKTKVRDMKAVRKEANKPYYRLVIGFFTGKIGIRDYFQLTFVVSTLAFIIVAVWFGWALVTHFVLRSV